MSVSVGLLVVDTNKGCILVRHTILMLCETYIQSIGVQFELFLGQPGKLGRNASIIHKNAPETLAQRPVVVIIYSI